MPQIVDIVTAPPPYVVEQAQATAFARSHFGDALPNIDRLLPLFANTGIKTRRLSQPHAWYLVEHDLGARNRAYIEIPTALCTAAGCELLLEL